ncbi:hypothetical protein U9M48_016031 [Paspalum notatum var. saurae]|uniref:Uncharacterized protein n=1 Tax=Paspalum notatum var. saurae TaxID=547442 RepID=A0AAQ3WME8_PASNO
MEQSSGVEHMVHIPAHGAAAGWGQGKAARLLPPERRLNCFVRSVALIERVGNALGTLAFTWATVVLLGGYPTALRVKNHDFWFAITIFFLEAVRMFSRNNRMDYRFFFGTRGAFRPIGWNRLILVVYFNSVACMAALKVYWLSPAILLLLGVLVAVGQFVCPGVPGMLVRSPQRRRLISVWSPLVAIILLSPSVVLLDPKYNYYDLGEFGGELTKEDDKPVARWIVYAVLLVVVLLVTVSRMGLPAGITRLVEKAEFWRRHVLNFCMVGAIVLATFALSRDNMQTVPFMFIYEFHLATSKSLQQQFVWCSLCYVSIPRTCTIKLRSMQSCYGKPRTIFIHLLRDGTWPRSARSSRPSLEDRLSAAVDSKARAEWTLSNFTTLCCIGQAKRMTIRLFAAKVVDEIAESLLVVTIPGIIHNVSLLLGCGNQRKGGNPLLDTDGGQEQQNDDLFVAVDAIDGHNESGDTVPDTANLLQTQDHSTQPSGNNEHNCWCWIARWCRQVSEFCTVPQEGPLTEHDLLPVLGMSIIERLAAYDQSNCEEISKTTGLIRKITRFTRFSTIQSSLKLFQRLTSTDGEIGVTLRHTVSNHPFLLRNLSEILGDMTSCHEPRKLAAEVLRNLAVDDNTRQKIGRVQRIIARLMQAFLAPDLSSCTDGDRLLSKVAGQALAMMAMGNADNCRAMLRETGYSFIEKLADMIIRFDSHRCVAASLLRSMRMHARDELAVQERILHAEGAELEIFIGLSSHIYEAIPEEFAQDFECVQIKENFVKHLVSALKTANREPNADCPGIRRVIVEQAIKLMEYDHRRNINCFRDLGMTEELLTVEETISDDENCTIFMGDVGLMEAAMAQSSGGAVEHRLRMPGAHHVVAAAAANAQGRGATRPEKQLNCFVRFLALIERAGNALGTLAFTWATVVLLGGYPTAVGVDNNDFWFAITIFFLEAARMFSRNNRMDYQLFFGTRGAFRPIGWKGLILVVYFYGVACMIIALKVYWLPETILLLLGVLVAVGQFVCPGVPGMLVRSPQRRRLISVWSSLVAIILLSPSVVLLDPKYNYYDLGEFGGELTKEDDKPVARWIVYAVLLVVVLLVTVSRMGLPAGITRLVDKAEFWRRHVLNFCMVGAIVLASFALSRDDMATVPLMILVEACVLFLVSLGNFQIPAATVHVVLPLLPLHRISHDYQNNCPTHCDTTRINLAPSVTRLCKWMCIYTNFVFNMWIMLCLFVLSNTRNTTCRMFSRNNRMDYRFFFGTRGAFSPIGWNGLILVVYFNSVACMAALKVYWLSPAILLLLGVLVAVGQFVCPGVPGMLVRSPQRRRLISVWSPLVAIILLSPSVVLLDPKYNYYDLGEFGGELTKEDDKPVAIWIVYAVLLVVVLLVTVSRMGLPAGITRLVDKAEFWRRLVLNFCMVGAIVLASFALSRDDMATVPFMFIYEVFTLVLVSFGNFQIPAATVRVVLPLLRLGSISHDYKDNCSTQCDATPSPAPAPSSCDPCNPAMVNLAPSLYIFYGMVLGQGALYAVACVLEIFSTIPRRSLVRRGGFKGQSGVDSVKLYYAYALEKCLERNVLAPKISLCSFAIDSLDSDSTKRQIHGIRTAHILLQMEPTRTRLLVKLNASTNTMTRLVSMLHWAGQENDTIRLFAAKVVDEIAESLLVVTIPGIIQNVSLLLGCGNQRKGGNPLLDTDGGQEQQNDDLFVAVDAIDGHNESGDTVPDTANLLQTQDRSTQPSGNNEHNCWCWIARWCRQVSEFCTVPQEGPLTEHDLLPVLGMSIIERLAAYDQSNCEEISKTTGLISKITRFTRFSTSDNTYTDAEKKVLVQSSLKLFQRLTSIDGEIGVTLRRTASNHPFLLRNLSEILGDMTSCHEPRKLAAEVLRNLAVDDNTRQKIGRVQRIIARLMQAFLAPDLSTDGDRLLSKVAGQALAMMAMGNADNCRAMLRETGYSFIEKLADMIIRFDSHRCVVAASLLRSMCMHARDELTVTEKDLLQRCSISVSRKVQERILRAEGAELEIFIGLSSHIYEAIPEEFAQDFECVQIKENFVKHLVSALKTANREPNADCPGIRRVIVEQAIKLMEYDHPRNINCFRDLGMTEELLTVEETISDDENCTIFMGDVGLMEAAAMAQSSGGAVEHRLRMPGAHHVVAAAAAAAQGRGATRPEKQLNCFVRFLALIERAGNALGTLAFTWATVVLLGGYPTAVGVDNNDFWFAITIFFLEAARAPSSPPGTLPLLPAEAPPTPLACSCVGAIDGLQPPPPCSFARVTSSKFAWVDVLVEINLWIMLRAFCLIHNMLHTFRMFGRNNRMDYQLFFGTRGAFRPIGWKGLILVVYFNGVACMIIALKVYWLLETILLLLGVLVAVGQFVCPGVPGMLVRSPQRRRLISVWSPLVAIILLSPSVVLLDPKYNYYNFGDFGGELTKEDDKPVARWIVYAVLLVVVLLVTVSRMGLPAGITRLVDKA